MSVTLYDIFSLTLEFGKFLSVCKLNTNHYLGRIRTKIKNLDENGDSGRTIIGFWAIHFLHCYQCLFLVIIVVVAKCRMMVGIRNHSC